MDTITRYVNMLNTILLVGAYLGGLFAFRNARKSKIVEMKNETIQALQEQIDVIKMKIEAQEKENNRLKLIIETMQEALKQKGIIVTIDGELVTLTDASGARSSMRRKRTKMLPKVQVPQSD